MEIERGCVNMATNGKHGATENTPKNILLGAGTYHKNFKWDSENHQWTGPVIGATSGGGKVSIEGEYLDLDIDGMLVLTKGFTVKNGGKASMEANVAEITGDNIMMATNFKQGESDAEGYDMFVDKPNIEEGDYTDGFAFVGKTANGARDIIVIFESSLCKSAFELETKNKDKSVLKLVMEAYAENQGDLDTLPVKIYYPTTAA